MRSMNVFPYIVSTMLFASRVHCQYNVSDYLNFALNLECLEARFYSFAVYGHDLSSSDLGHSTPVAGRSANLTTDAGILYATAIAEDEIGHVRYLRRLLGPLAVPCPLVDIEDTFSAFANAALGRELEPPFSPYNSDVEFFISSFLFEDAGVTGYRGAIRALLDLGEYEAVDIAAGLLSVESYHAGVLRGALSSLRDVVIETYGISIGNVTTAATDLINSLFKGEEAKAIGLADPFVMANNDGLEYTDSLEADSVPTLVPVDSDFIAFSRNTSEILKVVYIGSEPGGFYPEGFNGVIA